MNITEKELNVLQKVSSYDVCSCSFKGGQLWTGTEVNMYREAVVRCVQIQFDEELIQAPFGIFIVFDTVDYKMECGRMWQ